MVSPRDRHFTSTLRALIQNTGVVGIVPTAHDGHHLRGTTIPLSDANAFREYGAITQLYGPSGSAARAFLHFIAEMPPRQQRLSG